MFIIIVVCWGSDKLFSCCHRVNYVRSYQYWNDRVTLFIIQYSVRLISLAFIQKNNI